MFTKPEVTTAAKMQKALSLRERAVE